MKIGFKLRKLKINCMNYKWKLTEKGFSKVLKVSVDINPAYTV